MASLLDFDWVKEDALWAKEGIFQSTKMFINMYRIQCLTEESRQVQTKNDLYSNENQSRDK
jgi:hypothetical protein